MIKICRNCLEDKEDTEFYKDSRARDGLRSYCKRCYYEKVSRPWAISAKGRGVRREYDRNRKHKFSDSTKRRANDLKWREINKCNGKRAARRAVSNALMYGKISKKSCELRDDTCAGRIEADHWKGYEPRYYLDVKWLCKSHHFRMGLLRILNSRYFLKTDRHSCVCADFI